MKAVKQSRKTGLASILDIPVMLTPVLVILTPLFYCFGINK